MKAIKVLTSVAVAALVLSGCANRKLTDNKPQTPYDPNGRKIETPCGEYSMDDSEYFRGRGVIEHVNEQSARMAALVAAKEEVKRKIGGFVQQLESGYFSDMAGQAAADKIQRANRDKNEQLTEYELGHAEKICEETRFMDETRTYRVFMAVQIPKQKIIESVANSLSRNEQLEIEFEREQFLKWAEQRTSEMQEARKNYNQR